MCYPSRTMAKRAGTTEKISISIRREDLAALKKRAKRLYGGNMSAVIAELAADAKLLEGMHAALEWLGGPIITDEERAQLDAEWGLAPKRKQARRKRKAA